MKKIIIMMIAVVITASSCKTNKPGLYNMNNPCLGKKYLKTQ